MKLRVYRTKKKVNEIYSTLEENEYKLLGKKKEFADEVIEMSLFF